jgi:hypothetical protein
VLLAGVLLMAMIPALAGAEPQTLFKPHNIEIARDNIERYPWAQARLDAYRNGCRYIMEQDREWIEEFVPKLTPGATYGQVCPNCVGEQCSMGESSVLSWSVSNPDVVTCKYCGTVYPNEEFPETGSMTAERMGQTFTYYVPPEEAAHPEDDTGQYAYRWASWPVHVSFSGLIRLQKASWVGNQALVLAKVYALTGEVEYAERCAWVLDTLARAYPGWLYHSYYGSYADMPPGEAAAAMGTQPKQGIFEDPSVMVTGFPGHANSVRLWGFWGDGRLTTGVGGEGSYLLNWTVSYDLIRDATFADGTKVLTPEMDERIVNDLILAGCADLENYRAINNKCGPGRALSAACGTLFGQPERVRRGLEGLERLLDEAFHFDGFCRESPSYSSMHLGGLEEIPDIVAGYSDPEGYLDENGERFDDLNAYEDLPRYRLALLSMVRMMRPDRHYPVIGDTHYTASLSSQWAEVLADNYGDGYAGLLEITQGQPLAEAGSEYALWHRSPEMSADSAAELPLRTEYWPGWQVAALRNGDPAGQTALFFNGYAYHGHRHMDTLGMEYFALGREMASDRGYIWDDPRNAWTKGTLSHNLVTVDLQSQVTTDRTSTLELFATAPELEVIQASSNAYEQCSQYRRTMALVQLPGDNSYAVDIFRVTGGSQHHYGLNSNGSTFSAGDLALAAEEGMITIGSLKWGLTNLRTVRPEGPWHVTWTNEDVNLDCWSASPIDRLVVGDAPGWRTYKGTELHAPPITQILAERSGEGLDSLFATVIAPWQGEASPIAGIREVRPDSGAVAVVVEMADRTDWIISALDDEPRSYGPITMSGRLGFVSFLPDGSVRAMYLHEGTSLTAGDEAIELDEARVTRGVASLDGTTMTLAEPLPEGMIGAGAYLRGAGTGWEIERAEGSTIEVREYPLIPLEDVTIAMSAWRGAR